MQVILALEEYILKSMKMEQKNQLNSFHENSLKLSKDMILLVRNYLLLHIHYKNSENIYQEDHLLYIQIQVQSNGYLQKKISVQNTVDISCYYRIFLVELNMSQKKVMQQLIFFQDIYYLYQILKIWITLITLL